ncbi:MAG: hypothetical protein HYU88_10830 [Chloroflexi bacterium]|nr:hypothetical protein [Chloroflexota bacterium]
METEFRETAGVLAGLVGGMALAVLLLFTMMGGGFMVAVLVLTLLPLAFGTLAVADLVQELRRHRAVAPAAPSPAWRAALSGVAVALAIIAFAAATMAIVRGPSHALADIRTHAPYLLLVALGGGALAATVRLAELRHRGERYAAMIAGVGVLVALTALLSCCLWAFASQVPLMSLVVLALLFNEVPVALAGLALNAVGLVTLARFRRPAPAAV